MSTFKYSLMPLSYGLRVKLIKFRLPSGGERFVWYRRHCCEHPHVINVRTFGDIQGDITSLKIRPPSEINYHSGWSEHEKNYVHDTRCNYVSILLKFDSGSMVIRTVILHGHDYMLERFYTAFGVEVVQPPSLERSFKELVDRNAPYL